MSEILNFDYTLKDIQNIGEIINKQSKELDMTYQEYLNYIRFIIRFFIYF